MGILSDWLIQRDIKIEPFVEGAMRPGVISYGVSSYGYDVRVGRKFKVFGHLTQVRPMSDATAGWLAGIIDGEGCITTGCNEHINARSGKPLPRLTVTMTHRETVERLCEITGVGQIQERKKQNSDHSSGWTWDVTRTLHLQTLLLRLLPYMVTKREKALEVIGVNYGETGIPIVDPKDFDERCFEDHEGDFCLIPPNSFALAETVEYLEIPRDVLGVALGKSTYARCGIVCNVTPLEPEWRGKVTIEISNTTPLPAKIYAGEGIAQILFLRAEALCRTSYGDKKGKYQDQKGLTLPFVVGEEPAD